MRGLLGALLAVAGIAIMFAERLAVGGAPLISMLAIVAAAACTAEAFVVVKRFPQVHQAQMNAIGMAARSVLLIAISTVSGEHWVIPREAATWRAVGYLVLVGSVLVFSLGLFVLKRWTASAFSYAFVLFPPAAVALSGWLDREPVTLPLVLGGGLVLVGVYVGALARPRIASAAGV